MMISFNSMGDVKKHLESLKTLSVLEPEDYALEGKIADIIAGERGEMKFTQIRKFFGHIKKIETVELKGRENNDPVDPRGFYPLMPELAYSYGRGLITRDFYEVMKICLSSNKIKTVVDFKRFVNLLTAVIAYHKKREMDKKGGVSHVKQ
ncbi:MAG: type III-A CRISPR-associated protein Csm2 [Candidatus Brocadia sp.]|nr:type III-A CRISPR-associated protein Csm2 [Candidatus Brocadia sp.]